MLRGKDRKRSMLSPLVRSLIALCSLLGFVLVPAGTVSASNSCQLNSPHGNIQHVIEIQFDNTHFTRDNPNVPSDLEQMPNLLNFIENNGALLTNHHTPLISHTATDILTTLTGVYGDRHGVPVSNSFRYFNPNGTSNLGVAFAYWTDPLFDPTTASPTDTTYNMLTAEGKNAPAPWVPFTRAGCNFGAISTANIVLENNTFDIPKVFGATSPENAELQANPNLAFTDFVGLAVHCAAGDALCSSANNGRADLLPDEPGGYSGFNALFGAKYVNPQLGGTGGGSETLNDLNGQPIMNPASNTAGFPGFDGMPASVSLAYVATMQEHGIPVTFAYISDAHDKHPSGPAYGPGEAGYVAALKADDNAFAAFFTRLASDGINSGNTLFVFSADENDHFAGGTPTNACDGVNTPCTYSHVNCSSVSACPSDNVGELNASMAGLLATEQGITTPFKVHSDSAPTVYITGNPARDAALTRAFERATGQLTATNLYTGLKENLTVGMADPVEMKLLHMITADPARTPTFTWFARPDYFFSAGAPNCNSPCVQINPAFAWNHGDVTPDITTTWLGMVGPGVDQVGIDSSTWSDHTDVRPTMLALVGLTDDYVHDGRVLTEDLNGWAIPAAARKNGVFVPLAQVYKQLNASVGQLGLDTLQISTKALSSGSASDDSTYASLESQLSSINSQRDALAGQMIALLEGAEFNGQVITQAQAQPLITQGQALLDQVHALAGQ
ncbi:MAG TPA: hypothetical protein VF784_02935 [Anaerolineales bacterium]